MRVALVSHGLPPRTHAGIEAHAACLADALAELEHEVEAFALRTMPGLAPFAQRREGRGRWAVTWVNVPGDGLPGDLGPLAPRPEDEDLADAFGAFLDRERPDVVHFERIGRFGVGVVEAAKRRGIPMVYAAHDYSSISESRTLLRPDLTDFGRGDREEDEVRSALAIQLLRQIDPTLARSGHARPEDLPEGERDRLARVLGDPLSELEGVDAARRCIKERLTAKRAAFASLDARFASSRAVARRLSSTLGRAVEWRPVGVPTIWESAPPARGNGVRPTRPVRFGFLGEIEKPEGLHLLLEAYSRVEGSAELVVHGDSTDRAYLARCRERALSLDVTWAGPLPADGTADALREIDVRVLPSLWEDGLVFGVPQAFAARRPVIAPRGDVITECVRDDVDGVLFARGDPASLAAAMQRFVSEQWLLDRMGGEVTPPKSIEAEARDWTETYGELVDLARRRTARPRMAPAFTSFEERLVDLRQRPVRELFSMVANGLTALAAQVGVEADTTRLLATALGRGSRLRDGLARDQRALTRLASCVAEHETARSALDAATRAQEAELETLRVQIDRLAEAMESRELDLARLAVERDQLKSSKGEVERARAAIEADLSATRDSLRTLEVERSYLEQTLEQGAAELAALREGVLGPENDGAGMSDAEAIERHFTSLQSELDGLRRHEAFLHREAAELIAGLGADLDPNDPPDADELRAALARGREQLARLVDELSWRRREMSVARSSAQSLFARIAGGSLVQRVRGWQDPNEAGAPAESSR